MKITDIELVERWQSGDEDAFCALLDRYAIHVKAYLCDQLRGFEHVAEDLTQRTFMRLNELVMRGGVRAGEDGKIEALLISIVGGYAADHLRHEYAEERLRAEVARTAPDGVLLPDAAQAAKEAEGAVQEALAKLSAENRAAVTMYFMEKLSAAEVARRLRKPERTVRRMIANARELLCIWLEPYWKGVRDGES